ncbi:MAG: CCA tRNA nucleotidyltransferase [Anaerolineaceae bacterium]|nr:MAG: CCA tRNA nucleotidyltransferase [Anaerolineaceae bacterium]
MPPDRLGISRFIPTSRLSLLRQVADLSAGFGSPAYLVGGFVRDALLGKPINDFDLVIEGDATKLGRALVQKHGGRVTVHAPFKTATWFPSHRPERSEARSKGEDDFIDLISARSETYEHPAALPTVKLGSLADDLRRRDFTINAMAVRLDGDHFGELADPLGGRIDLERGLVRVLHLNSFVDDPTRLFRAVRYAARYDFQLESSTEALIPAALKYVDKLSPERLRHELDLIFEEEDSVPMLEKLWTLGIIQQVHPALPSDEATRARVRGVVLVLTAVENPVHFRWAVWLMGLMPKEIRALSKRLHFSAELLRAASAASSVFAELKSIAKLRPSGCVRRLNGLPEDALWAVSVCAEGEARSNLEMYLKKWKSMKPYATGETLFEMGVPFGPRVGEILWRLRAAWLDGEVTSEEGERKLMEKLIE